MKHLRMMGIWMALAMPLMAWSAPEKTTLYRDTWGVPHVYADSLAGGAYTLGYAQAEDRLDDLYLNIRTAIGSLSEVIGEDGLETDIAMNLVRNAEYCKKYWEKDAPEEVRQLGDSFIKGVQAYLAEHPERQSPFALELAGWQCLAVSRTMIFNWPLEAIQDKMKHKKDAPPFISNSYAVSPSRSADGTAILMTDPHLTWKGMAVFSEARVHAGDLNVCGFYLVGAPLPVLGHSANVAWACTTGGPDTVDVFMVKLNPKNPLQYEYNGEWKDFEMKPFLVKVKGGDSKLVPALYSVYGPMCAEPDIKKGIAYFGSTRYIDSMKLMEQSLKMLRAKSVDEFRNALGMFEFMEQNISFADTDGHIAYLRNGAVPIRPEGVDCTLPIPGGTDKTRWLGFHPLEDLVQIQDPPQGYFQNCNCSPAVMMRDSPMTEDKYKSYIFNVSWDKQSPRGARLLQLLDGDDSITREEAMHYTLDVYDILSKPWQGALTAAVAAVAAAPDKPACMDTPEWKKAVDDILAWNGEFTKCSIAAPFVKFWRLKCEDKVDVVAIADGKDISAADQRVLVEQLGATLIDMKAKYGKLDITWGDINLVGRDGKFFACDGADFGGGKDKRDYTQTPMVTGVREEPKDSGKYVAYKGSSSIMLSFLSKKGIDSYSLVVWGQNGDAQSKHHVDQSEKLYSQRKFKPTWFNKEDLLKNIESEKTLTLP